GRPVHSSARVAGRRRQIEPTDRRRGSPPAGHRAEDQLLVKLRGAAVYGTPNEVGVAGFHLLWAHHVPGQDQVPETGGPLLDPLLDTGGKRLQLVRAPAPRQGAAGVALDGPRNMGVGPSCRGPRWCPARIGDALLAEEQEGPRG